MSFDPATVAAFVDGELDDLTARRIEREAESDAALAAEIARHRALNAKLAAHFAPVTEEAVPERLRALLIDPKLDTSLAARREAKQARFDLLHWGAIAAALVLGLTIGLEPWERAADVSHANGTLVASGALATALDTQLASNQPVGADVRIGLTFRDEQGRTCRSFEGRDLSGIGCRDRGRWALERTMAGHIGNDYRQASSGALANDVAKMMAGDAFDAAAERAARKRGWSE
ncbi:MAG: anti-sigma factor [Sphingopyxis sp.]|nr:anti-sigma factor [Sphingopyxis sp.]